jgi:hypothetical protein
MKYNQVDKLKFLLFEAFSIYLNSNLNKHIDI